MRWSWLISALVGAAAIGGGVAYYVTKVHVTVETPPPIVVEPAPASAEPRKRPPSAGRAKDAFNPPFPNPN